MTREEAIDILMDDAYLLYEDDSPYNREAYDMAIEALKKQRPKFYIRNNNNVDQKKLEDMVKNYSPIFITPGTEKVEIIPDQQWIPCSERLPEYDKDVLCYTDAKEFIVGHRVDNWGQDAWITGEFGDGEFNAIAWMPLPEPYTEEE